MTEVTEKSPSMVSVEDVLAAIVELRSVHIPEHALDYLTESEVYSRVSVNVYAKQQSMPYTRELVTIDDVVGVIRKLTGTVE